MPSYAMCPKEKKKPYVSDKWLDIMKDGVGLEFEGEHLSLVCVEDNPDCTWFIKAKRQLVNTNFVVSHLYLKHDYIGTLVVQTNSKLGVNIIGDLVLQSVRMNPTITPKEIMFFMEDSYIINLTYVKAWRIIDVVRNKIFGSYDESYDHLRWYSEAIVKTNSGSVVCLEENTNSHHFERIFIVWKTFVNEFRSCRPMLFIDGLFMKGRVMGTLLSATATAKDVCIC
ncbi:hypothetical protein ACS0TY_012866 [Phlomoides rotata]